MRRSSGSGALTQRSRLRSRSGISRRRRRWNDTARTGSGIYATAPASGRSDGTRPGRSMVSGSQTNSGDISPTSYDSLISWPITIREEKRIRGREGGSRSRSRIKRAAAIERQRQIQTPISIAISKAMSLRLIKPSAASASVASSRSWAESNTATRCCTLRPCWASRRTATGSRRTRTPAFWPASCGAAGC
ncbi:hypothetical protein FOMG_18920 [Fusarium oxysporum f. sp. melonis 26406]|uniref:Uncharacterized protein n=2 Tax=Fusarium oxysporum TaxID=5507 RepID=W9Z6U9_FUSOX|nr:hypothetical protein FOVG_16589 [Fusarium oxysporum f. sp. pisi HDV247]EXK24342.1 hypothetical protein FOMG_18920 [Fusarium oxysporum f. sp. melonis 26406]